MKTVTQFSIRKTASVSVSGEELPACAGTLSSDEELDFRMPTIEHVIQHRACVARPVARKEAREIPKARAALDKK